MIIKDKIRNRVISAKSFTFSKSNKISKSEGKPDGEGGGPFTGEKLVRIGSEAGTFGR